MGSDHISHPGYDGTGITLSRWMMFTFMLAQVTTIVTTLQSAVRLSLIFPHFPPRILKFLTKIAQLFELLADFRK